jgi:hypothetical protein
LVIAGIAFRHWKEQFDVEIRGELRQTDLSKILLQFGTEKCKWLLVARYIPGPLKDELRKNGINYLERAGNCFISTENMHVYINDREVKQARETPEGKLWKSTGLKLLFILIQDPGLAGATYRQLSELAGVGRR